ncbi:MAG TPA: hypothetical protein VIN38_15425 [Thiobacillus sp.]
MPRAAQRSVRYWLAEFFGQIVAGIILFAAFVAWAFFSSIYAAIPVLIIGIVLWGLADKVFDSKKGKDAQKNKDRLR